MQDRRSTDRRRALSTARLTWPAGGCAVEAVLRDLSRYGAMLLVDEPLRLPAEIDVSGAEEGIRRARVVWRSAMAVGVSFVAPAAQGPGAPLLDDRVVSFAAAHRARQAPSDAERLASRIAAVLHRRDRPRPAWL